MQLSSNKKRNLSLMTKTDEKQKHQGVLSTNKNFRKYKKQIPDSKIDHDINVLGQPLQNRHEDFQSIIDKSYGNRMGKTGLRGKIHTRLMQQTSLNLPSMAEKPTQAPNSTFT